VTCVQAARLSSSTDRNQGTTRFQLAKFRLTRWGVGNTEDAERTELHQGVVLCALCVPYDVLDLRSAAIS
jgi:hypothetical protein